MESVVGPPVREMVGPPRVVAEASSSLREHAAFAALLEERPELEADFNEAMVAAYRSGGMESLEGAAFAWASARVGDLMNELVPYARDEDLRAWVAGTTELPALMLETDPFLCHDFLFGGQTGHPLVRGDYPPEVEVELIEFFNEVMPPLIRNRPTEAPFTPTEDDQAALSSVASSFVAELGQERVRFVQGERPETEQDARIVCRATTGFYESILAHPRDVAIARIVLTQQP